VNYLRYSQYVLCTYSRNELWSRGIRVSSSQRSREATALYARAGILRVCRTQIAWSYNFFGFFYHDIKLRQADHPPANFYYLHYAKWLFKSSLLRINLYFSACRIGQQSNRDTPLFTSVYSSLTQICLLHNRLEACRQIERYEYATIYIRLIKSRLFWIHNRYIFSYRGIYLYLLWKDSWKDMY